MRRECSSQEAGERLEEVTLAGDCAASMSKGECIGHDGVCVHGTNGYIPLVVFFGDIAGAVLYTVRHGGNRDVEFFQFEGGERCCCRLTPGIHLGGHGARIRGSPRGWGGGAKELTAAAPIFSGLLLMPMLLEAKIKSSYPPRHLSHPMLQRTGLETRQVC